MKNVQPADLSVCGVVCPLLHFPLRSEEHTSELQSRLHLVCRLLLEKKKHFALITRTAIDCAASLNTFDSLIARLPADTPPQSFSPRTHHLHPSTTLPASDVSVRTQHT